MNDASRTGGGIYSDAGAQVTLDGVTVEDNRTEVDGLINSTLGISGGINHNSQNPIIIRDSIIQNNTVRNNQPFVSGNAVGGGIAMTSGTLENVQVRGNVASSGAGLDDSAGGGLYIIAPTTIRNSVIDDNQAGVGAGLVTADLQQTGLATRIEQSTISNNTATRGEGGG